MCFGTVGSRIAKGGNVTLNRALYGTLIFIGAIWGGVFTLSKIAVSTGHQPLGLLLWQLVISVILSSIVLLVRGRLNCFSREVMWLFFGVAVLGTVVPNYISFRVVENLPAGILVIIIALVPLFALPMALAMKYEKFDWKRFSGIGFGGLAVWLLVGPEASLPDSSKVWFVLLGILVPFIYAAEGTFLTWVGDKNLDPVQILFGASILGVLMVIPLAIGSGQFLSPIRVWGAPEYAIAANSIANWIAYIGYIWLIRQAGPVFAAQVSYVVTGFGVVWAMVFLGESYSIYIWLALGLMMCGLFMVQPKERQV